MHLSHAADQDQGRHAVHREVKKIKIYDTHPYTLIIHDRNIEIGMTPPQSANVICDTEDRLYQITFQSKSVFHLCFIQVEIKNSLDTLNSKVGSQGKSCSFMLVFKALYPYQNQMSHLSVFARVGDCSEKHREHMEWIM